MLNLKFCSALAIAGALIAVPATAGTVPGVITPLILAGNPADVDGPGTGDSPAFRVDPNTSSSKFAGVVSLNIRYPDPANPATIQSFICSGALIDATHVLTAGHCVDTDGQGHTIDVSSPYAVSHRDVRVVFNSNGSQNAVISASNVVTHPDYAGFGNCPAAAAGQFCVNDDVSIVTLAAPAPITAQQQVLQIHQGEVPEGSQFISVGYGTSGNGVSGYTISPSFSVKRMGTNNYDLYDQDDEQGFAGGPKEVWYADFDGTDANGVDHDVFCTRYGVCSGDAGNRSETTLGGGDSGGPSFIMVDGHLELVANNTFSGRFNQSDVQGTFGTYDGGILIDSYRDFIYANSDAEFIPEPAMVGLFGLGALGLVARRRRKTA